MQKKNYATMCEDKFMDIVQDKHGGLRDGRL